MAGSFPPGEPPRARWAPPRRPRFLGHQPRWLLGLAILAISAAGLGRAGSQARGGTLHPGTEGSSHREAGSDALLADYFRRLLDDRDAEAFRERVAARYTEARLCGIVVDSPAPTARRAAVVALGLLGRFERSNAALGRALRDGDAMVRQLAEKALWSVWFGADTPENNRALQEVAFLIGRGQLSRAEALATRLIVVAPEFAEAYNQRAIIYFQQGRFAESARDCRLVLSRNPYHFGALSGLAQCQHQLDRPDEAVKALRQALKIQPFNEGLRAEIQMLEARMNPERSR